MLTLVPSLVHVTEQHVPFALGDHGACPRLEIGEGVFPFGEEPGPEFREGVYELCPCLFELNPIARTSHLINGPSGFVQFLFGTGPQVSRHRTDSARGYFNLTSRHKLSRYGVLLNPVAGPDGALPTRTSPHQGILPITQGAKVFVLNDIEGKFGGKYEEGIKQMLDYVRTLDPDIHKCRTTVITVISGRTTPG